MATQIIDTEKKTAGKYAREFFTNACIAFAVAMVFFLAAGTIFKGESHASGVMMGWGLLVACIVSSGLQLVFFTPALIKRMSYPVRATLFGLCFFPVLAGIAALFSWFPMEYPAAWIELRGCLPGDFGHSEPRVHLRVQASDKRAERQPRRLQAAASAVGGAGQG